MIRRPGVGMYFPDTFVDVFVPIQKSGIGIIINEKDYVKGTNQPDFTVVRELTNFEVIDKATGKAIEIFAPPMEITVCYTDDDIETAVQRVKPLKLGVWIDGRWWTLPIVGPAIACPHGDGEHAGAYRVFITGRWADPELAWGT